GHLSWLHFWAVLFKRFDTHAAYEVLLWCSPRSLSCLIASDAIVAPHLSPELLGSESSRRTLISSFKDAVQDFAYLLSRSKPMPVKRFTPKKRNFGPPFRRWSRNAKFFCSRRLFISIKLCRNNFVN